MNKEYSIPDWALIIYLNSKDKIGLTRRLYGKSGTQFGYLIKWQHLINDFKDEDVQAMQSQIIAEIKGWA